MIMMIYDDQAHCVVSSQSYPCKNFHEWQ